MNDISCCGAPTPLSDDDLARVCKALGHPLRVRILRILASRDACIVGDLVELLPVAQSTVSQHLKVLKGAGVVIGEIDGPRRCYCLNRSALAAVRALLGTFEEREE